MSTSDQPPTPPPVQDSPPPAASPFAGEWVRRLRRIRNGKVLAGVAGGLGAYLNVDPVVIRIAFIALSFFGGFGVFVYLLAWVTVPAEDAGESLVEGWLRRVAGAPQWVQVLLGAILLVVLLSALADGSGIVSGLVLIALGVLLFRRSSAEAPLTAAPATSGGATAAPYWSAPRTEPLQAWPPPAPPAPRRPPSILGRATLGCTLLALGAVATLDLLDLVAVDPEQYLAIAITLVGAGLLVGSLRGHARGLIVLGIALVPPLLAANLLGGTAVGGIGERFERPSTLAGVADEYRLSLGYTRLDLSDVEFAQQPTTVSASVGLGELLVVVPPETRVEVDANVRVGELDLFGQSMDGTGLSRTVVDEGVEGGGRLELDLDGGAGLVTVRRAAEPRS